MHSCTRDQDARGIFHEHEGGLVGIVWWREDAAVTGHDGTAVLALAHGMLPTDRTLSCRAQAPNITSESQALTGCGSQVRSNLLAHKKTTLATHKALRQSKASRARFICWV